MATTLQAKTLMIGDSIFDLTKEVPTFLEQDGLVLDNLAVSSSMMEAIAQQYRTYKKEKGIPELVIMDGGGNDILLNHYADCVKDNATCNAALEKIYATGTELLNEMREDGVQKIIYVGIHYFQRWNKQLNPTVDKGMKKLQEICVEPCTFIDLRPHFDRPGLLLFDDIHPNTKGSRIIADLILQAL
jgi:lysophospholipase L1-like esterase